MKELPRKVLHQNLTQAAKVFGTLSKKHQSSYASNSIVNISVYSLQLKSLEGTD